MSSLLSLAGGLMGAFVDSMKPQQSQKEVEPASPDSSIQVCVRIRPILRDEKEDSYAWNWEEKTMYPQVSSQAPYTFDHLFFPESSNDDIFNSVVKNVVLQSMNGFNGSIFTYGQTNSGKTFTMNGSQSQPGIIPLSVFYSFKSIQENFPDREFLFRVSYIEVYNEQVKDLLNTEPAHIKIQHDPKQGTILSGVKEQVVLSPQQVIALLKAGEAQRHVGATDMNDKSSRAHTLFKLIIESKQAGDRDDAPVRVSYLNLVDLAGSENAKMTNSTGERAREAKCINQSLLTLSLIIHRLSEEKPGALKKQYLPYRDSKLTRLLQTSLSGNAKIAVICTVSPSLKCVDESHNTLKFAARAKKIKTAATITEVLDDKTLLRAYKIEIQNLKARLAAIEVQPAAQSMSISRNVSREFDPSRSTDDISMEQDVDSDIESEGLILQMISEMERLILKADVPTDPKQKNGVGSKGSAASASRRRSGGASTATASNSTPSSSSGTSNLVGQKNQRDSVSPTPPTKSTTSASTSSTARRTSLLKAPQSTSAAPTPHPVSLSSHQSLTEEAPIELDEDISVAGSFVDLNGGIEGEFLRDKDCDDVTTIHTTTTRESISAVCSDATSLDDSFDGLTTSDSSIQRKASVLRPTSFSHNVYGKRMGLDSVSAGESDFLTVPTLYVDDCKSSSKVAKEYLRAISSPRNSIKISKSPTAGNSPNGGSSGKSIGGSTSSASKRLSLTSQKGQTTRKFGFIPSPSLSRSLLKVSKDSAGSDRNVSCGGSVSGSSDSRRISLDKNSRSLMGESDHNHLRENGFDARDRRRSEKENNNVDHDTATTAALVSIAAAYSKVGKSQDKGSSGNHVLFGVSQMLAILKKHVEKSSAAKKRSPHSNHALLSAISLPNVLSTIDEALKSESPRRAESACGSERQDYRHFSITTITSTPPLTISVDSEDYTKEDLGLRLEGRHFDNEELTPSGPQRSQVSESNSNSNDMNQSTWNADDRIFLLEELEKKDNMLAMLTEGLREVEISQDQWLAENDLVSKELLVLNQELNDEVNALKQLLEIRERQLVFISGVLPGYEDF